MGCWCRQGSRTQVRRSSCCCYCMLQALLRVPGVAAAAAAGLPLAFALLGLRLLLLLGNLGLHGPLPRQLVRGVTRLCYGTRGWPCPCRLHGALHPMSMLHAWRELPRNGRTRTPAALPSCSVHLCSTYGLGWPCALFWWAHR